MVRTQIQLTETQYKLLKALSHERGISIAELIRISVDEFARRQAPAPLTAEEKRRRIMEVAGRYRSGLSDVSSNHDAYLAEDYAA